MGTCQLRNCRCVCQQNRIACQCGSLNTIILEEQAREIRRRMSQDQMRSNRFINNKSKTGSPAQSNSSDSQNKTKFSTNRKASNRSPNSTERYLLSEECNIPTENSYQKKIRKPKIRYQKFHKGLTYFNKETTVLFKFEGNNDNQQKQNDNKAESPQFQVFKKQLDNKQTLDQIQSIKEPTVTIKTPTTTQIDQSINATQSLNATQSIKQQLPATQSTPFLMQQPSISRDSSPSKLSHPITQVSMEPQFVKQSLTVITEQQQIKNRSHTAELSDDQKSVTPRSVLKQQQKNNDSFRTQQQEKRRVRFDLPNSHYIKERQKQQQRFFN